MITKKQFLKYEAVRVSGVTNMFDVRVVEQLTDLTREVQRAIRKDYSALKAKYIDPNNEVLELVGDELMTRGQMKGVDNGYNL